MDTLSSSSSTNESIQRGPDNPPLSISGDCAASDEYEVRAYQLEGALFLASHTVALLGDEPGVGKTFQAIMAAGVAQCQNILVLCPSVARYHWLRQFEKYSAFGPWCSLLTETPNTVSSHAGLICSYDLAIRTQLSTLLLQRRWDVVICDEAHSLSNPSSQRAKLVWGQLAQRTDRLWCLTGTPTRNNVSELWPFLNAAGRWTRGRAAFTERFCTVVHTVYGDKITGSKHEAIPELKRLLEPVMLRRHVEDVMHQLPSLTHMLYPVERTQVDVPQWYNKVAVGLMSEEELYQRIADEVRATEAVLNVTNDSVDEAAMALGALQATTETSRRFEGLSKVPAVASLIKEELMEGHYQKIVLFAWHRDVIDFLKFSLRDFTPVVIMGKQLHTTKDATIRAFQTNPSVRVCLVQILAGGVAIDLTAATEVGFVEASYVPADNAQAVMRVHRFPQKRPVRSRFFLTAGSIDERIMQILRKKTADLTRIFGKADAQTQAGANPFASGGVYGTSHGVGEHAGRAHRQFGELDESVDRKPG